jgi:multidrug efflux pump subunit AcrA (membrane-fusion protein)
MSLAAPFKAPKLNLGFTRVKSPINGIAGIRVANIGDLVGTDQKALLTMVSQIDPIFVQFPISDQEYLDLRKFFLAKASSQGDETGTNPAGRNRL